MEKWKEYNLGELITLNSGGTPDKSNKSYWGGDIPWISAKFMYDDYLYSSDLKISQDGLNNGSRLAPKGSILLLTRGSGLFNRIPVCYVMRDLAYNQDVKCIESNKKELVSTKFLFYWLMGNKNSISAILETTGIGAGKIDTNRLKNLRLSLPPKEYQQVLIEFAESIMHKIELNRRINDNLEQQAQALFKSWFVDFEPFKDGNFVESEMGIIPEGWNVTLLSNIVKVSGGGTPRTNMDKYWNGNIPFFTPKDASPLYYTYTTEKHLTTSGIDNCNSRLYPSNTIVVTARGTVGKVRLLAVPMAMNQSCYALLPCSGIPVFYAFLLMKSLVDIMKKKSNGAVFDAITTKDFAEKIVLPRDGVLNDFSKVISPLLEKIRELGKESHDLALLRDALLPRLMSGELKINDLNC